MSNEEGHLEIEPSPCTQCGVTNRVDATFCGGCGVLLADPVFLDRDELFRRPLVVTVLAVAHFILGVLAIVFGVLVMFTASRAPLAPVFVLTMIGIGVGHVVCGRGLWTLTPGGRSGAIVFAALWLVVLPVGTVLGILTLVYLLRDATKVLFSGQQPESLSAVDLGRLHAAANSGSSAGVAAVVAVAVVLLFSVPMMGIVAAIAVPNLLNAIERGRCKRTAADLRTLATALEAHRYEYQTLPVGVESIYDAAAQLPENMVIPTEDGWGRPFVIEISGQSYRLISYGSDGEVGPDPPDGSFNTDFVFENGLMIQAPEGIEIGGG